MIHATELIQRASNGFSAIGQRRISSVTSDHGWASFNFPADQSGVSSFRIPDARTIVCFDSKKMFFN